MNIHIYPSELTHESRILRITSALAEANVFDCIEIIGVSSPVLPLIESIDSKREIVRIPRKFFKGKNGFLFKLIKTIEWSVRVLLYVRKKPLRCINAHSLAVLPLCAIAAFITDSRLVYDTHELETETSGFKGFRQKFGRFIERIFIARCDSIMVVSGSIADWYQKAYSIPKPTVVRNIPQFLPPRDVNVSAMRDRLGLSNNRIVFIYQGGFISGRGIERLLKIFSMQPSVDLLFMGQGPLEPLIKQATNSYSNIRLIPPVPPEEVLNYTVVADIGICLTDNSCLSHYYSLPNKVFEYLHAGLPIMVNQLKEQEELVKKYNCGWVASADDLEFLSMLERINFQLVNEMRSGALSASKDLSWDIEKNKLIRAYQENGLA